MTIAPFAFGIITCLAAQGVIFVFGVIIAGIVSACKKSRQQEQLQTIVAEPARDSQK